MQGFDPETYYTAERMEMRRKRKAASPLAYIMSFLAEITGPDGTPFIPPSALPPVPVSPLATYLVSGGQVTWISGLEFAVAAGTGFINGVSVSWLAQTVTLDMADPSDPRIDVIYVGADGTADSITGTASADPSEPVTDPVTQLRLALVTVAAGATTPTISSELVYAENTGAPAEWNWTTSGSGWDLASTGSPGSPHGGSVVIEGTAVDENAYVQGERGGPAIDPASFNQLVLFLGFKAAWDPSRYLQLSLRNAGVLVGNALRLSDGFFGLDGTNTLTYQAVIIPTLQFAVPAGTLFNQLRLEAIGSGGTATIDVLIDDITLTSGGITIVGGDGLTQDEADARYAQRASNLSDLTDVAVARANLQITHANLPDVDTDSSPTAIHHTLGSSANQAAAGTHTHATTVDEKVKISANDTTPGYANGKLIAGTGVTLTENNDGGNETLTIAATTSGGRYRAWTYTAFAAGEFDYVVDASGDPVYALMDLE